MASFDLKKLSKDSIPNALEKAKHYRLLNEPWQAESICRDILNVENEHQDAILNLILSITDQFNTNSSFYIEAKELCGRLNSEYKINYYRGLIAERMGKVILQRSVPRAKYIAYEYYTSALTFYEKSEKLQPGDNQESVLRWNACVRTINVFSLEAAPDVDEVQPFLDV